MCYGCEHGDRRDIGYMCEYRCKLINGQVSEVVDTYFNTRESYVNCPLKLNAETIK